MEDNEKDSPRNEEYKSIISSEEREIVLSRVLSPSELRFSEALHRIDYISHFKLTYVKKQ